MTEPGQPTDGPLRPSAAANQPLPSMPAPDRLEHRTGLRAAERHLMGDHRSCQPEGCGWAALWREPVLAAARAALGDSDDRTCAVACLACDGPPRILGTTTDLWSGKGWRGSHRLRVHPDLRPPTPAETWAWKSMVVVVQRDPDGTVHFA